MQCINVFPNIDKISLYEMVQKGSKIHVRKAQVHNHYEHDIFFIFQFHKATFSKYI